MHRPLFYTAILSFGLQTLREQAVGQSGESVRHALREAFVAADTARRARGDAKAMLDEAKAAVRLPYLGDAAVLHADLTDAIAAMVQVLGDAAADVEALWAAERRLWAAIIEYDTGRQPRVRNTIGDGGIWKPVSLTVRDVKR